MKTVICLTSFFDIGSIGFTGPGNYKKEAGVVHAGEFVANHNAVNNPQLFLLALLLAAATSLSRFASSRFFLAELLPAAEICLS